MNSTQSSSCSRSAFCSAQRNVDLPLSVGPSMAMPDSAQFFRYATSGSSLLDHRERHGLRGHQQAEARREALHVHRVIDRGRGVLAKRLPDPAPALRVAERAEVIPGRRSSRSSSAIPSTQSGHGMIWSACPSRADGRPPARGHDHRPPVRWDRRWRTSLRAHSSCAARRYSRSSTWRPASPRSALLRLIARRRPGPDLGRPVVNRPGDPVRAVGDHRDAQRPGTILRLVDELLQPVDALLQPVVAAADLDQADQVHRRCVASCRVPGARARPRTGQSCRASSGQPLEPDLPGPGQHRGQLIACPGDNGGLDLQRPQPLGLPRKVGARLAGDDGERGALAVRRLAADPDCRPGAPGSRPAGTAGAR